METSHRYLFHYKDDTDRFQNQTVSHLPIQPSQSSIGAFSWDIQKVAETSPEVLPYEAKSTTKGRSNNKIREETQNDSVPRKHFLEAV